MKFRNLGESGVKALLTIIKNAEKAIQTNKNNIDKEIEETKADLNELEQELIITDTATGEHITLTNSADSPVRSLKIDGKTEQLTTTGKNLLYVNLPKNYKTEVNGISYVLNEDGGITVNGTATDASYIVFASGMEFQSGLYILSGCPEGGGESTYSIYFNGGSAPKDTGNGASFTVTNSITFTNAVLYINSGVTVNNLTFYPMVRLASVVDATYEPYTDGVPSPNPEYTQDLKCVGESGNVEVTVTGKNLFGGLNFARALSNVSLDSTIDEGNRTVTFRYSDKLKEIYSDFKEDTQYTFILYGSVLDSAGKNTSIIISYNDGTLEGINIPANNDYVVRTTAKGKTVSSLGLSWMDTSQAKLYYDKCGIFEGVVSSEDFEEYKSQTVQIPVTSPLFENDSATLKNGKSELNRKFKIVDFPVITSLSTYTDGRKYAIFSQEDMADYGTYKCTHMKEIQPSDNVTYGFMVNQRNSVFMFDSNETVESANAKMTGAKVLYRLAEPTTEIIDTDIDLSTYNHVTNITNSDNANMEVEYFVNNRHADMVTELKEEIETAKTDLTKKINSKAEKTHSHSKADVGLGNVDNTSDMDKPVSTAQKQAINNAKTEMTNLLNDFIVFDTFHGMCDMPSGTKTGYVVVNVSKDGYIPKMATVYNSTDLYEIALAGCRIYKTDDGSYYVACYPINLSEYPVNPDIEITVLYVRDI